MLADFSSLIAATTRWLLCAYPPGGGALAAALCEAQARQAVTVAAWLRYPTPMDAALVGLAGPGGSARLDWIAGADGSGDHDSGDGDPDGSGWRTWVDEVVASWAACLLTDSALAARGVSAVAGAEHAPVTPLGFRRLTAPDARDHQAAALLRHPDLLAPVAALHRAGLLDLLDSDEALIA
ncbi:hypothetical protein [Streptomyces sp. enrichment culture]|uniref:hypothetical protein n=1 Tax=Streptomyces sp. enrichment culture TaxID=1795815 RepID=UPI003F563169